MSTPDVQLVNLTIDGVPVEVPKGTLLVEAAKTVKQEIPVYCYHTKLGPAGSAASAWSRSKARRSCRSRAIPSVAEGMVVHTRNEKVDAGRGDDPRTLARQSPAGLSRSATRAANAICKTTRWHTARKLRRRRSKAKQTQGRRSRTDDRARRRALRRLSALRAFRRHHR